MFVMNCIDGNKKGMESYFLGKQNNKKRIFCRRI